MRKFWAAGLIVAVALTSVLVIQAPAAAVPSVIGNWYSIDTDESNQQMTVDYAPWGSEAHYQVTLFDDAASTCGGQPAIAEGPGWGTDYPNFKVKYQVTCLDGTVQGPFTVNYRWNWYTLVDSFGVVWHRAGRI